MEITQADLSELHECLELLQAVLNIEYHNKNWLSMWAIKDTGQLNREQMTLIERMQVILGTSSIQKYT